MSKLFWTWLKWYFFLLKSYDRTINQSSFMNWKMISIDETFPVDGDFMLFLLISGVGCWIWVFVEGTLFVHVNLFHLLFNAGLLLINQTPPAHPTRAAARDACTIFYLLSFYYSLWFFLSFILISFYYLLTKPRLPIPTRTAAGCISCKHNFIFYFLTFLLQTLFIVFCLFSNIY